MNKFINTNLQIITNRKPEQNTIKFFKKQHFHKSQTHRRHNKALTRFKEYIIRNVGSLLAEPTHPPLERKEFSTPRPRDGARLESISSPNICFVFCDKFDWKLLQTAGGAPNQSWRNMAIRQLYPAALRNQWVTQFDRWTSRIRDEIQSRLGLIVETVIAIFAMVGGGWVQLWGVGGSL